MGWAKYKEDNTEIYEERMSNLQYSNLRDKCVKISRSYITETTFIKLIYVDNLN